MSHLNNVPEGLPSSRALVRSTLIAMAVAGLLLVGVVLPAEYGVDPVGIGRLLGLTEMGKIKMELAREADAAAAAERAALAQAGGNTSAAVPDPSPAVAGGDTAQAAVVSTTDERRDSTTVSLAPNESVELKLTMRKDQRATFRWYADSAQVNYNTHGEPPSAPRGFYHGYGKGTSRGEQGELVAAFDGSHGWFWRNRSSMTVRVTLITAGEYQSFARVD